MRIDLMEIQIYQLFGREMFNACSGSEAACQRGEFGQAGTRQG